MSSQSRHPFVGHDSELAELRRLADRRKPSLVLLSGRRHVGKTYLLNHAWQGRRVFYFLAAESTSELNRVDLLRELSGWSGHRITPSDYPTWRRVFRLLAQIAEQGPFLIVLDEFQYLMGHEDDIVSQLAAAWDREVGGRPLVLVLSGSEITRMQQLALPGQPLHGRVTWSARIAPLDYQDAARMIASRSPREAAVLYGIFGGTPRYLATIAALEDIARSVARNVLSPHGDVHVLVRGVVQQENGIREPAEYRAVLTTIAGGSTNVHEIAAAAGFGERPYVARRALEVLEDLGLVCRARNFDAPAKAPYQYRIADNALWFWYRFVHPNRSRLEADDPEEVWRRGVEPCLNDYMGKVFEQICREAFERRHRVWGLPGATAWARWDGRDRNRRSITVDIVARLDDGRILTGALDWSSRPVDYDRHRAHRRDLDDLSRSGQTWAGEALTPDGSAGHVYFSAGGFTPEFRQRASEEGGIRLLALQDLYAE